MAGKEETTPAWLKDRDSAGKSGQGPTLKSSRTKSDKIDKKDLWAETYTTPAGSPPISPEQVLSNVGEAARQVFDDTKEVAVGIADVAKDAAKATIAAVSSQASDLAANVADELTTTAEEQKRRGADTMRSLADAISGAAGRLNADSPVVARQFRNVASKVGKLSDNLRDHTVGELFSAASDLARRQPASFFVGAVVAGFALARFVKSSGTPASRSDDADANARAPTGPGS